jgi:hypothetical protein
MFLRARAPFLQKCVDKPPQRGSGRKSAGSAVFSALSFQVQGESEISPFALSLSKGLRAGCAGGFDRLSPNGFSFSAKEELESGLLLALQAERQ